MTGLLLTAMLFSAACKDFTFTVNYTLAGERRTIYERHPSKTVAFIRNVKLAIVRDQFGECVAIKTYSHDGGNWWDDSAEWKWFYGKRERELALRRFVAETGLGDHNAVFLAESGDGQRSVALSKLLDHLTLLSDTWFYRDECEWYRKSGLLETVVDVEDTRKVIIRFEED